MFQNFLSPSDMNVLILNTVPKQSENLVVADFLLKKKKSLAIHSVVQLLWPVPFYVLCGSDWRPQCGGGLTHLQE